MTRPDYQWKLPPEILKRLGSKSYGSQRAMLEQAHLLLVTHQPPSEEGNERRHEVFLRKPDGKWMCNGMDNGQHALLALLEAYDTQLNQLENRYREATSADTLFEVMDRLLPLTRAATNLKDALQAARDMVKEEQILIDMRDRAVDVARGFELLLANARIAIDYRLARQAEEQTHAATAQSKAQRKLNVIAALTFPLMTVATVFGMNLHHGLEFASALWFWVVFAGGLMAGILVKGWVQADTPALKSEPPRRKGAGMPPKKKHS
jgi:Mg2+ and Co2+ transporter CorA